MAFEIALAPEDRALLVPDRHGTYYNATRNDRMFCGLSATTGIVLIAAAAGGGHPTLFNPAGSKRVLSVRALKLGYVTADTNAPGSLAWNIVENAGANIGPTGAAILTATRVAARNLQAGSGKLGVGYWSPTTNSFTAAPVYHRPIGLSLFTGAAATAVAPFPLREYYDGSNLIMPGTALCLVTVQATTTSFFRVCVEWEEVDL